MTKIIKNIAFISLFGYFITTLFSCNSFTLVNDVPLDNLPDLESKIVLSSFISPQDSIVMVSVTKSQSLYSTDTVQQIVSTNVNGDTIFLASQNRIIADAIVELSDGQKSIKIPYDASYQMFTLRPSANTMLIEPGKTYTLSAQVGNKKVKATCTVPKNVPILEVVKLDTVTQKSRFSPDFLAVKTTLGWDDVQNEKSFYRIRGRVNVVYLDKDNQKIQPEKVANAIGFNFSDNEEIRNDIGYENGKLPTISGTANLSTFEFSNGNFEPLDYTIKPVSAYFELLSIDENYYKYYRSLFNYDADNPFVEPTPVYSNVEGGLGCFAASNRTFVFKTL